MDRFVCAVVRDEREEETQVVRQTFHHIFVNNQPLHYENACLREALKANKAQSQKSRPLDLQQHEEYWDGTTFWSPLKFWKARWRNEVNAGLERKEQLRKANEKELKVASKL